MDKDLTLEEKKFLAALMHKQLGWVLLDGDADRLNATVKMVRGICIKFDITDKEGNKL